MVYFAIFLMVMTHLITNVVIELNVSQATVETSRAEVVKTIEANPIAKIYLNSRNLSFLISFLFLPASLFFGFNIAKRRYKEDSVLLESLAMSFLLVAGINFLNDFSILLVHLQRFGII